MTDYKSEADKLVLFAQLLDSLDLDFLIDEIETAHAAGPVIEPTMYRDAHARGDMDRIDRLARALREPQRIARDEILPRVRDAV